MYFRGPHGRLALPNESPSLNKANLLTFVSDGASLGRTGQKDMEGPEYPKNSRPVEKCIIRRMEHYSHEKD